MGVICQYRSTQTGLWLNNSNQSGAMTQLRANATTAISVDNVTTESGVFGSKFLNRASASVTRSPMWPGFQNTPSGVAFAILVRIVPRFTGTPAAMDLCLMAGSNPNTSGRIVFSTLATGAFRLNYADADGQTATSITTTSTKTNYVSGTAVDLMVSWDGTTGANAVVFGVDGASFETKTAGTALYTLPGQSHRAGLVVGNGPNAALSNFDLNELVIFDNAQSVVTGVRTQFWTTSAFDASAYTFPADGDIRSGVSAVNAGVTRTPSLVVPTLANTKTGVAGDGGNGTYDGSDRWSDPGIANVRSSTAYKANSTSNNHTGTAAIPTAANVRAGTATDATTGSLAVPAANDVRFGTSVDAGTGTCHVPGAANVRSGTSVDATTGLLIVPAASDVRSGTAVDATTGSMIANLAADVKHGVSSDGGTGTYRGADLWDAVSASQLKHGLTKNQDGSSIAGTYQGDDVNDILDPSDLLEGVSVLNRNATVTGTLHIPVSTNPGVDKVTTGTSYTIDDVDYVGTRETVTNLISNTDLQPQALSATLEAE